MNLGKVIEVAKDAAKQIELNRQETKELQYFQTIQVQKQRISAQAFEIGQLRSEVEHLNHLLNKKMTAELISMYQHKIKKSSFQVKYYKLLNDYMLLRKELNK